MAQALPGKSVLDWPADGTGNVGRMGAIVRHGGSSIGLTWTAAGFEFAVYSQVYNTMTQHALAISELVRVADNLDR